MKYSNYITTTIGSTDSNKSPESTETFVGEALPTAHIAAMHVLDETLGAGPEHSERVWLGTK